MTQRLPTVLTPIDVALRFLLDNTAPVQPAEVSVADSIGCIVAAIGPMQLAHPAFNIATSDGWALQSRNIVGASSYSPLPLAASPVWVEAGDRLPDDCDCVLDDDLVEQAGPIFQILAEALPGHGIRRAGDDIAAGRPIIAPGRRINEFGLLAARAAGISRISIRSPRVSVIDVPSSDSNAGSAEFVREFANASGARVVALSASGRDAASISAVLDADAYDLILTVGGTGLGRSDAMIEALAARGSRVIHGLALQPGRTGAVGMVGTTPVIAISGMPEQALAVCLMLVQPVLDLLTARSRRRDIIRPLARKISSSIGVAEIVLLETLDEAWMPIAVGQLSLEVIARAEAWLAVPGDSEGYAAGTAVGAFSLRDMI